MSRTTPADNSLRCSFCHKPQKAVRKLMSSPSDYPRAYICDECIAVCAYVLEDDRADSDATTSTGGESLHPWVTHPLASELMACVADWIGKESLGENAAGELDRIRDIAGRMRSGCRNL